MFKSQKGFSFIFVIIFMVVLILVAGLIYYFIAVKPIFTTPAPSEYKNPFSEAQQFKNPFDDYQNPFEDIK